MNVNKEFEFYIDETNPEAGPVVRWVSSNNIPFPDMLERFLLAGVITDTEMANSIAYRKVEDAAFIEMYIANRQQYGYSPEELFEMKAAFGDEEVVDVFTGQRIVF